MITGDKNCACSKVAGALVIIGAINWGLVGLGAFLNLNLNVVNLIFGRISYLEEVIYVLVGLAGVAMITKCKCKSCCSKDEKAGEMKQ
jgi:uncharacterized membrane protein YuzA (DUF378 family)